MRALWLILLLFSSVTTSFASLEVFSTPREWSNDKGQTLTGVLLSYQNENIIVQRSDGLIFALPLEQLSEKDKSFIESLKEQAASEDIELDRQVNLNYTVFRKYTTGGEIIEIDEKTKLGFNKKIRIPTSYFVIVQGDVSKLGYIFSVSHGTYQSLIENDTINVNNLRRSGLLGSNLVTDKDDPIDLTGPIILSAKYGTNSTNVDVTALVQGMVNDGKLSIPVGNHSMGGDPAYAQRKHLKVTYSTSEGTFTEEIREGGTLHLR